MKVKECNKNLGTINQSVVVLIDTRGMVSIFTDSGGYHDTLYLFPFFVAGAPKPNHYSSPL